MFKEFLKKIEKKQREQEEEFGFFLKHNVRFDMNH